MASFGVFGNYSIIETSQEWGRILWNPWQCKLKLKYINNFAKPIRDVRKKTRGRSPTTSSFAWLCETSHTMRNHLRQPKNFAHNVKFRMVCEIFLCIDSIRFLSLNILCNFLFSPCNQNRYFLLYLYIFVVCNIGDTHRDVIREHL